MSRFNLVFFLIIMGLIASAVLGNLNQFNLYSDGVKTHLDTFKGYSKEELKPIVLNHYAGASKDDVERSVAAKYLLEDTAELTLDDLLNTEYRSYKYLNRKTDSKIAQIAVNVVCGFMVLMIGVYSLGIFFYCRDSRKWNNI